jgi:hypothetical protein
VYFCRITLGENIVSVDRYEMQQAMASTKSYVGSAVVTFVAYMFFWLPGLIFNIMYLQDARRMERVAGHSLSGVGCLWLLLILNVVVPFVLCSLSGGLGILSAGR